MTKLPLLVLFTFLSACVELSPAGAHVQVITADQLERVTTCKSLGSVSVTSVDALRNASAAISGDTVVISYRAIASASIVHGDVYRCSIADEKTAPAARITAEPPPDADSLRKSNLCQSKGGVWTSGQCVLSIE